MSAAHPGPPRLATGPLHFLRAPNTCEHLDPLLRFPPTTWSGPLPLGPGQQEPRPPPQAGPTVCGQTDLSEQGLQSHWALGLFGKPSEGSQAGRIKPTCLMPLRAGLALSGLLSATLCLPLPAAARPAFQPPLTQHQPASITSLCSCGSLYLDPLPPTSPLAPSMSRGTVWPQHSASTWWTLR